MATAASNTFLNVGSRSPLEYWHLLSLDAPTVAVLWAWMLCNAAHVALRVSSVLFIGLGTWLLYAADRILDGFRPLDPTQLRERHYFHQTHRRAFGIAGVVVVIGLSLLACHYLPKKGLSGFCLILAAALGYFVVVHWGSPAIRRWFPKELAVGGVFASAVAVPAWSQLPPESQRGHLLAAVTLLAVLFWLNCVAIESWERSPSSRKLPVRDRSMSGRLRIWRDLPCSIVVRPLAIGVATAAAGCLVVDQGWGNQGVGAGLDFPLIYLCSLASAAALFYLDVIQSGLSPLRLRVAADVALLTPLPLLLFPTILALSRLLLFRKIG